MWTTCQPQGCSYFSISCQIGVSAKKLFSGHEMPSGRDRGTPAINYQGNLHTPDGFSQITNKIIGGIFQIAFIAWITPETKFLANVGPTVEFKTVEEAVIPLIKDLRSTQNITRIIGLSHTGYVEDLQFASLAKDTELDLIIGGHSHSFLADSPYPITLEPAICVLFGSDCTDSWQESCRGYQQTCQQMSHVAGQQESGSRHQQPLRQISHVAGQQKVIPCAVAAAACFLHSTLKSRRAELLLEVSLLLLEDSCSGYQQTCQQTSHVASQQEAGSGISNVFSRCLMSPGSRYTLCLTFGALTISSLARIGASLLADSSSFESGSGHQQPLRQMLHVAGHQADVNALCKASLVDPELMDLQEDELDDFLHFEAMNISEECPDSKYYNNANIHVVVGGLRSKRFLEWHHFSEKAYSRLRRETSFAGAVYEVVHPHGLFPANYRRASAVTQITFIHWNDQHARVEPADNSGGTCRNLVVNNNASDCFGGYARLGTFFKQERADPKNKNVFVINGGDEFTGTIWDDVYKGTLSPIFLAALDVDMMILGNHEFDLGADYLGWWTTLVKFPLLCSNLVVTPATANLTLLATNVKPYIIKTLDDGSKIAFIAWITPETKFLANVGPNVEFKPIEEAVIPLIKDLKSTQNITRIIGLSHTGRAPRLPLGEYEPPTASSQIAPTPLPCFPTTLTSRWLFGPYPTLLGPGIAPVVQAYYASKYIGKLQTFWEGGKLVNASGVPVVMGGSSTGNWVKEDPQIQALVDQYLPPVRAYQKSVIGATLTPLNGRREDVRSQETNLGDLTCQTFVEYAYMERLSSLTINPLTPISIAVYNSGGIRASINGPNITVDDVLTTFPFGNTIAVVQLNGSALLDTLNWAVSAVETVSGRFLQVEGSTQPRPTTPVAPGVEGANCHSCQVHPGGIPWTPTQFYSLLTNSFVAAGGDGFVALGQSQNLYPFGPPVDDIFQKYVELNSPLNVSTDGRIVKCDAANSNNNLCTGAVSSPPPPVPTVPNPPPPSVMPYLPVVPAPTGPPGVGGEANACSNIKDKAQFVKCLKQSHGNIFNNLHSALNQP
eukprot:jgi/Botrbrau1/8947/Bobra.0148s0060.1